MALPLIPILTALAAGGSLVPHAAGGMIVSGASGYVAGTYLSTAAIAGISAVGGALGAGVACATGAASSALGFLGAKVAAIGAGSATVATTAAAPVAVASAPLLTPVAVGGAAIIAGAVGYQIYRINRKLKNANGREIQFTEWEAKMIEYMIKRLPHKS